MSRKCANTQHCKKPAIGNAEFAYCRGCYREKVKDMIGRVCFGNEDCDYDCQCGWSKQKERKIEYFKEQKAISTCSMCQSKIRYAVLTLLYGGEEGNKSTRYAKGAKYGATLCHNCSQYSRKAYNRAFKIEQSTAKPKEPFLGIAYRIEDPEGIGPFRSKRSKAGSIKKLVLAKHLATMMGVPEDEGIYDGLFAFTSMAALNYYIRPELLKYWISLGFVVKQIKIAKRKVKIFDNGLQLAFKR